MPIVNDRLIEGDVRKWVAFPYVVGYEGYVNVKRYRKHPSAVKELWLPDTL